MYSVKEVSQISWLSWSALRFYEEKWLIKSIKRDSSSKHRLYNKNDVDTICAIACLSAMKMPIETMKKYMETLDFEKKDFVFQIDILKELYKKSLEEEKILKLRKIFIKKKIYFFENIEEFNENEAKELFEEIFILWEKLRKFWQK